MSETLAGKVLVAQGGGPTAVINQSLVGVVLEARKFPHISRVYGAIHGVRGIVDEDFLDLSRETSHNLELVASTTSSALLSTRDKPDTEYCGRMFEVPGCRVAEPAALPRGFRVEGHEMLLHGRCGECR